MDLAGERARLDHARPGIPPVVRRRGAAHCFDRTRASSGTPRIVLAVRRAGRSAGGGCLPVESSDDRFVPAQTPTAPANPGVGRTVGARPAIQTNVLLVVRTGAVRDHRDFAPLLAAPAGYREGMVDRVVEVRRNQEGRADLAALPVVAGEEILDRIPRAWEV